MRKCDVCGKTSLLPEKLGEASICKVCLMKINGPLWKYRSFEKYDDVEREKVKVLENAQAQNFPPLVLDGIETYFSSQTKGMQKCDACGEIVQHLQSLGKSKICKKCFSKINTSAWRKEEYACNEDVEQNRQKTIKIATKNGFPPIIIEGINLHFNSKIQKGLIRLVDGHRGQKLKVYETHSILITSSDFDVDEISKEYGKAIKKSQPQEGIITNAAARTLAKSLLSGGIVKAGINLATSAAINAAADAIVPSKGIFKVIRGSFTIDYTVYDNVEYQKVGDNDVGFIRFRNSKNGNNPAEDIVFFFGSSTGKEELYNEICECIKIAKKKEKEESLQTTKKNDNNISVADEILKFKNLLDMGAITQEEFEKKKSQLLNF